MYWHKHRKFTFWWSKLSCFPFFRESLAWMAIAVKIYFQILLKHMEQCTHNIKFTEKWQSSQHWLKLPPFSLKCDFRKQNTRGNVSKISVSLACYWQIGSKSTNNSLRAWRREGLKVTLVAAIGGFRSDLSITRKTDGNFGNVSEGVLFSKVTYQQKRW